MRFWDRVRLGFGIVFGRTFGIIIDRDYANGGDISGFNIRGADVGILVVGSPVAVVELKRNDGRGILVEGNLIES